MHNILQFLYQITFNFLLEGYSRISEFRFIAKVLKLLKLLTQFYKLCNVYSFKNLLIFHLSTLGIQPLKLLKMLLLNNEVLIKSFIFQLVSEVSSENVESLPNRTKVQTDKKSYFQKWSDQLKPTQQRRFIIFLAKMLALLKKYSNSRLLVTQQKIVILLPDKMIHSNGAAVQKMTCLKIICIFQDFLMET